jgi:phage/conjugal plasmid C-4 type zinc finger TraR family protein
MADEADIGNELAQMHLDAAIAAARRIMPTARPSADVCEECGLEISSARQNAVPGCTMCTDCAELWESKIRRGL